MVTIIWETWLNPGAETEGLRLTRQIWSDMKSFDGYLSHQMFVDQDTAGHLFVVSQWRSRAEADRVKDAVRRFRNRANAHAAARPPAGTVGAFRGSGNPSLMRHLPWKWRP